MPLASITKIPDSQARPAASGMRSTEAQDRVLDVPHGWLHDRRVWMAGGGVLLLLVVLGLVALLHSWATSDATVSRERIRVATVTRGEFLNDVAAQATVVAAVSPTLYAPAAGTVTLERNAGDRVHKGDLLATVAEPEPAQ